MTAPRTRSPSSTQSSTFSGSSDGRRNFDIVPLLISSGLPLPAAEDEMDHPA
jgi:hypothetical protein